MGDTVFSQSGDTTTDAFVCFNKGTQLLKVDVFSRDKVSNVIIVGCPTMEQGLFLEVLVFLRVLFGVGLLSSAIGFFRASGQSFHIPVNPWLVESCFPHSNT